MVFKYPDLRQDGLRLLRPVVAQRDFLSFQMSCFPRQPKSPRYTAVSYTWGDGAPTERIYINGQPFHVRRNLWDCLYHLCQHRNVGWTHLWVDAISIDQTNDRERGDQVRVMDTIYRNAICVSVWLGLPPSAEQSEYLDEQTGVVDDVDCDWFDAVQDLANRPYWGRVWVIQEFLLGRDVNIHCGNSYQNWDDFKDLLGHQTGRGEYLQETFDYSKHPSGTWLAWPLVVGRHPDRHPELQQPLCELLINHCNSLCKDPRDRVFGLLGLVPEDERVLLERFFPDYTMSEDDVIVIAVSHVRQVNVEYDGRDSRRLFLGLGIDSEERRKRLLKRADDYDYFSELPPRLSWPVDRDEIDVEGTNGEGIMSGWPPTSSSWSVDGNEIDVEGTNGRGIISGWPPTSSWWSAEGHSIDDEETGRGSIAPSRNTCDVASLIFILFLGTLLIVYYR